MFRVALSRRPAPRRDCSRRSTGPTASRPAAAPACCRARWSIRIRASPASSRRPRAIERGRDRMARLPDRRAAMPDAIPTACGRRGSRVPAGLAVSNWRATAIRPRLDAAAAHGRARSRRSIRARGTRRIAVLARRPAGRRAVRHAHRRAAAARLADRPACRGRQRRLARAARRPPAGAAARSRRRSSASASTSA